MPSSAKRALLLGLGGFAVVCAGLGQRAGADPPPGFHDSFPLRFDSETVRLFVEGDSLRVEGTYTFVRRDSPSSIAALLYPYPADSLLGGARTLRLEARTPGSAWRPLEYAELPESRGARWRVPLDLGDTLEVRTVYQQEMRGRTARYIVTTTHAWSRPLREARFEIHLPAGATPKSFSYPFTPQESEAGVFYLYEAENFTPATDIVVEYELRSSSAETTMGNSEPRL